MARLITERFMIIHLQPIHSTKKFIKNKHKDNSKNDRKMRSRMEQEWYQIKMDFLVENHHGW